MPSSGVDTGNEAPGYPDTDAGAVAPDETVARADDAPPTAADLGRLIVYTATLEVEVEDVVTAGAQARAAVAGLGGVLFGEETVTGDRPRSVLTIKVPPQHFQAAMQRLADLGRLRGQSVYADDVTERVVDLGSRITTAEASVERLRGFLSGATDLEAVARLERELLDRETELELLRGQLRTLEGQVAMATVVLILTEPVPPQPEPALDLIQTGYAGHDGGSGCPGAEEVRIAEGEPMTVCFEVVNTGDTPLTGIEVRDSGLKADPKDLIVVEGDPAAPLPPEGRLILAFETDANLRRYFTDPTVRAQAVDAQGDPLRVQIASGVDRLRLQVDEDDSLPGFMDAMKKAWAGLQRLFGVVVVLAGGLIPFIWVPILLGAGYWLLRRRRGQEAGGPPPPEAEA
jgi:hypothetical protein